ncbi:MAG: transketolase [Alphaproteobacteria bacterium BRH_c36]|nr:MAG: transketolase [Alphaproteobacteria bacterium BRH_c36]
MSAAETNAAADGATHDEMANAIRALAMDAVQKANSGHPGMPMGMADVACVLFTRFLKIDPAHPKWPDRDRFVLSAGHGSMLQYALHYLVGYADMTLDEMMNFRQLGSRTAGHPEFGHAAGIETTTGPLGQGLATSVGMALAERMLNARYGDDLVDHHTYVIAGDGCLMEGISHEAIDMAGHLKLGRLIVLWDDNSISIDGSTDLSTSTDQLQRFAASGWHTSRVDGHDAGAIARAIEAAQADGRPSLIACKTIIGKGAPTKQGTAATHGSPLGDAEIAAARETLSWTAAPFEIPEHILTAWRTVGRRHGATRADWQERLGASKKREDFEAAIAGALPTALGGKMNEYKAKLSADAPKAATRKSSEMALEVINANVPFMVGGSADLTGSNNTKTKGMVPVWADNYGGDYIYYGVREFGMAAAMNGIALHGGLIPYGGTFLVFTDYARPAIRLSALMGQRVIYVMTHDSIGLGEDGPTHQPVEHLASLRAMPNLNVFRPCDAVETAECWLAALEDTSSPSVLALSRQNLPTLRTEHTPENVSARGGYVLREANGTRDVTILATGSEVEIAVTAAEALAADGIRAAVVSMPCWEKFEAQEQGYRDGVIGTAPRIAIEAGVGFGWEKWLGGRGQFIGMKGFGASAPADKLYEHFGITAQAVVEAARTMLGRG